MRLVNKYQNPGQRFSEHVESGKGRQSCNDIKYYDGLSFCVRGKYHHEKNFNRLPEKFKTRIRPEVWELSKQPAGISVCFTTNSPEISVKWTLADGRVNKTNRNTDPVRLDLYCLNLNEWQFVNSLESTARYNSSVLISEMDSTYKQFVLYLPQNTGLESVQIGVEKTSSIFSSNMSQTDKIKKPIVFYGTSITQGIRVSRPGMVYPSLISRKLGVEAINLGFSGNGLFESSVGEALCEIDAALFVVDCTPNADPETIRKNALNLIIQLRTCRPSTPILLIESIVREFANFKKNATTPFSGMKFIEEQNKALREVYDSAVKMGIAKIEYLESNGLTGDDHDGTVDGIHPSDLGQYRIAENIIQRINQIPGVR
jgi:hypothetical protein